MSEHISPDKPVAWVRSFARNCLPEIWIPQSHLIASFDPDRPDPGRPGDCFADSALTRRIEPRDLDTRITFRVVGGDDIAIVGVVPYPRAPNVPLVIADTSDLFVLGLTDQRVHADGTAQIFGAGWSLALVPVVPLMKKRGAVGLLSGLRFSAICLQKRSAGTWMDAPTAWFGDGSAGPG